MVRCPRCLFPNHDSTTECFRCGCDLLTLEEPSQGNPIEEPSTAVTAKKRPRSAGTNEGLAVDPSPETVHDRVVGGTQIAPSADLDLPMNESSVAQVVHATIPATDPADKQPTPPPAAAIRPKLVVLRGMKIDTEYPIYEGRNTIGRFADKPVDIDLVSQESPEQIWCSRQHAVLVSEKGNLVIEDLNSLNGTWVNGVRIYAGQPRQLRAGDVVQIGTVQMKLVIG